MDYNSLIVGLGGLFLGGVTTYFAYKSSEQLEIIKNLISELSEPIFITSIILKLDGPLQDSLPNNKPIISAIYKFIEKTVKSVKNEMFLSNNLLNAYSELTATIFSVFTLYFGSNKFDIEIKNKLEKEFFEKRKVFIATCRKDFGIELLSEETLKQINSSSKLSSKLSSSISENTVDVVSNLIKYI